MVVAVALVGMMKVPGHQVIYMVSVGNRFVTTSGTVDVSRFVRSAVMLRRASVRIALTDLDGMLVDVVTVHSVKVPFM